MAPTVLNTQTYGWWGLQEPCIALDGKFLVNFYILHENNENINLMEK
jgi:hypothetical protein